MIVDLVRHNFGRFGHRGSVMRATSPRGDVCHRAPAGEHRRAELREDSARWVVCAHRFPAVHDRAPPRFAPCASSMPWRMGRAQFYSGALGYFS